MNNTEQTSYQERLETAGPALERLSPRLDMLIQKKDDLLSILNNVYGVVQTIYKIQHGQVITTKEFNQLGGFGKINGLSTKLGHTWWKEGSIGNGDDTYYSDDISSLSSLIYAYPYIVDADQVGNIYGPLSDDILCIRKDKRLGIIKKGIDKIEYLLAPDTYTGALTTANNEYKDFGIAEIRNFIEKKDESGRDCTDYIDTTFLKIKNLEDPVSREIYPIGRFKLLTNFDKDDIAVALKDDGEIYCFVHKHFVDKNTTKIYQLGSSFASDRAKAKAGFDEYNSFAAEGRMIYKKRFNKAGTFDGIDVFKKPLIGKEALVENYKTSK